MKFKTIDRDGNVVPTLMGHMTSCIGYLLALCVIAGTTLYYVEFDGNVKSVSDGIWLIFMTITTIGFGDFYPTTELGRGIIVCSFVIGALLVAKLLSELPAYFQNDSKARRYDMLMNELARKLEMMEYHAGYISNGHYIDEIMSEEDYSSDKVEDGKIACGYDSSGLYVVSVIGKYRNNSGRYSRWLTCADEEEMWNTYRNVMKSSAAI